MNIAFAIVSILPWAVVGAWGVTAVCVAITMCNVIMIAAYIIITVFAACARQSPYRVLFSQFSSFFGAAMSVVIIKHDILPFFAALGVCDRLPDRINTACAVPLCLLNFRPFSAHSLGGGSDVFHVNGHGVCAYICNRLVIVHSP